MMFSNLTVVTSPECYCTQFALSVFCNTARPPRYNDYGGAIRSAVRHILYDVGNVYAKV